ncbi:MAG TPA: hypothetical protein PK156_03445 [Polyangium sp.]|nr:hypothetical protein [Polyangium sp.]
MHVRALVTLGVSLLSWTLFSSAARAQDSVQSPSATKERRVFVGLSGGAAYAIVKHPLVNSNGYGTGTLGMHAGYNVTDRWSLGVELSTFEHGMSRTSGTDPFTPTAFLSPQAGCNKCKPPEPGGWISQTTAMFGTVGPRVEFSPMGRDGLYLGATTGLGMLLGIDTQYGFGGGARAGYRYRVANILGFAVEGGVHAQYFNTGSTVFPYVSLMMRPYF